MTNNFGHSHENFRNSLEPDKEKLEKFIYALSNSTYETFESIPDYAGVRAEDYLGLLLNLTAAFKPSLTIGVTGVILNIVPTITEMGICYAVNSRVSVYNSPE